jgi:short-subunit dehydrogenase
MAETQSGYALVTGASKGIGAALAEALAKRGHPLILVARSRVELEALAAKLTGAHQVKCVVLTSDLSQATAPGLLWAEVERLGLPVEVLINNAGFGLLGPFKDNALQSELDMIQLNISALTALSKLALPAMLARKQGRILNVASTAAFVPGPFMAVYYASKAYVLSFSEALSSELEGTGVTVTALCPGATRTEFAAVAGSTDSKLFKGSNVMDVGPVVDAAMRGLFAGKSLVIPGFQNKLLLQSLRFAPRKMTRNVAKGLQGKG